mmetsp:Transcript_55107/g.154681  ORF Transcript_55107/g.154681 Transcript_55107/m.154681 type:complete len:432 (-) Transcript_55107:21-1316(-)
MAAAHHRGEAQVLRAADVPHHLLPRRPRLVDGRGEGLRAGPMHRQDRLQVADVVADRAVPHAVVEQHLLAQLQEGLDDGDGGHDEVGGERLGDGPRLVRVLPRRALGVERRLDVGAVQVRAQALADPVQLRRVDDTKVVVEQLSRCGIGALVQPAHCDVFAEIPRLRHLLLDGCEALLLAHLHLLKQLLGDHPLAHRHLPDRRVCDPLVVHAVAHDDALERHLLGIGGDLVGDVRDILPAIRLARDPQRVVLVLRVLRIEAPQRIDELRPHLELRLDIPAGRRVGEARADGVVHRHQVVLLRQAVGVLGERRVLRNLLRPQVLGEEADQRGGAGATVEPDEEGRLRRARADVRLDEVVEQLVRAVGRGVGVAGEVPGLRGAVAGQRSNDVVIGGAHLADRHDAKQQAQYHRPHCVAKWGRPGFGCACAHAR